MGWTTVRFKNLPQKKWFTALLLILLAVETAILVAIIVAWFAQNQAFPSILVYPAMLLQCYTLTATETSRNQDNRTVLFDCRGTDGRAPALRAPGTFFEGPALYPHYSQVAPSFSLPQGYLKLSLTYTGNCTDRYSIPLTSGQSISVSDDNTYGYCAIIGNSTGTVRGFTIRWYFQPFPLCCRLSASPSQITISAGQTARVTILVNSLGPFSGNVSLNYYVTYISGSRMGFGPRGSLDPASLILKPGGSNSTILTLTVPSGEPSSTNRVDIFTYAAGHNPSSTSITVIIT